MNNRMGGRAYRAVVKRKAKPLAWGQMGKQTLDIRLGVGLTQGGKKAVRLLVKAVTPTDGKEGKALGHRGDFLVEAENTNLLAVFKRQKIGGNRFGIVGTPGEGFGENGAGYFRLTAFGNYENTVKALERIKALK